MSQYEQFFQDPLEVSSELCARRTRPGSAAAWRAAQQRRGARRSWLQSCHPAGHAQGCRSARAAAGGSARHYEAGSPADEKSRYLRQQAEKYRAAWRLAWDFPEPEPEPRSPEEQADRWLAELDTYGISRVGFATGGGNETLALALKTASQDLKDKILKNMSERAAQLIQEDMQYMGPVRVADVEQAQQKIVDVVRRLEDAGEIIISGRGGEKEMVV